MGGNGANAPLPEIHPVKLILSLLLLAFALPAFAADADIDHPAYRGKPGAAGGTCCANLREVRTNIDRIDHEIVKLIAERGSFVHEAARFKENPAAVEDKNRVEAIIQKLRGIAGETHVAPEVVEATYRAMIAAFTEEEKRVVEKGE